MSNALLGFVLLGAGFVTAVLFSPWGLLLILFGIGSFGLNRDELRTRGADCPACQKSIRFWVTTAFSCPYFRRTLMQDGNNLYDITEAR